jgi:hypothetical protein
MQEGLAMTEIKHVTDNPEAAVVSPVGATTGAARPRRAARTPEYARLCAEYAVARQIAQQLIKSPGWRAGSIMRVLRPSKKSLRRSISNLRSPSRRAAPHSPQPTSAGRSGYGAS